MQCSTTPRCWSLMRSIARISFIGLLSGAAFGQPPSTAQTFEIANVRVSASVRNPKMQGGLLREDRYELRQASMLDMIRTAYGLDADAILGGPSWLGWDRFDVVAKVPPSASPAAVKVMLQLLLADRFQLAVHKGTKLMPGFVLTVSKGKPKLREADGASNTGCLAQPPAPAPGVVPFIAASCRNITMEEFAATLRELADDYLGNPVVDSTGLKGTWDFDFRWTPRGPLQAAGADGLSIFDAVEKLGLKLQPQKVPMPVIVVDGVKEQPTPNSPEITAKLSLSPGVEFEVAAIRPSLPDTPPPPPSQFQPGGRLTWRGVPLRALIIQAWDLDPDPHSELIGAPKWLDSARFDLIAKAPAATTINGTQIWNDDLQTMLRALLVDRFKMAVHYEDRPVDVYTLVAVKPKLRKADPSNRTGCTSGPSQAPGRPQDGLPTDEVVCRNVTMAQFAERLQGIARSYVRYPVLDGTGIEGAWDFSLIFTPAPPPAGGPGRGDSKSGPPPGPEPPGGTTPGPFGGVSLFGAVEKQLGLSLEVHKRPMSVLVIDHIEQKPTDN